MPVARIWASISASEFSGVSSAPTNGASGDLAADFARHAHAGAQDFQIILGAEKILPDAQRRARIGRRKLDPAAALRPQQRDPAAKRIGKARQERRQIGFCHHRAGIEQKLDVRQLRARRRFAGTQTVRPARRSRSRCRTDTPWRVRARCDQAASPDGSFPAACVRRSGLRKCGPARFLPTPGSGTFTSMPWARSSAGSPMPESISTCGELMTPPARMHFARGVDANGFAAA